MLLVAAGPMQSGKQENSGTFKSRGFTVLDLNNLADEVRLSDPTVQATYRQLGLHDTLTDTGGHGLAYYLRMLAQPELQDPAVSAVVQAVTDRLAPLLQQHATHNLVVSWGYAHLLKSALWRADHVLLFSADEPTWFDRLRRRAAAMSGPPVALSDEQLRQLIAANGMSLPHIKDAIATAGRVFWPVDTTPDDWGSHNLNALLSDLLH